MNVHENKETPEYILEASTNSLNHARRVFAKFENDAIRLTKMSEKLAKKGESLTPRRQEKLAFSLRAMKMHQNRAIEYEEKIKQATLALAAK